VQRLLCSRLISFAIVISPTVSYSYGMMVIVPWPLFSAIGLAAGRRSLPVMLASRE
jgi:hypothetical protein